MIDRSLIALLCVSVLLSGCASSRPAAADSSDRGVASWYGQEYAGRTTANGEIFDPAQLTAAHRTLPFGTVVEVRNLANGQTVTVRINDRGPFISGRIIDLSFAAAREIGLVEKGVGEVELRILRVGAGPLEPPRPVVVTAAPSSDAPEAAPAVPFPLPEDTAALAPRAVPPPAEPVVVDTIVVEEIRDGVPVRRQVSEDGTRIEEVPMTDGRGIPAPRTIDRTPSAQASTETARGWDLQLGAFGSEANARALADKVRPLAPRVRIEIFGELFRVRIGAFPTREAAIEERERLEAAGIESLVVPAR